MFRSVTIVEGYKPLFFSYILIENRGKYRFYRFNRTNQQRLTKVTRNNYRAVHYGFDQTVYKWECVE